MLWLYCAACFSRCSLAKVGRGLALCFACQDELNELTLAGAAADGAAAPGLPVTALFRYQGLVRELFLRAKVKGDQRALALVLALAAARLEAQETAQWADLLVPGPSSLWGRLRGRLDLASHAAERLATRHARPIVTAPLELHWRWRKSAQQVRLKRELAPSATPPWLHALSERRFAATVAAYPANSRVLLIDDVLTTGSTLRRSAQAIKSAHACTLRCLTLARS